MNGLKLKNRLVRSATGENLATAEGHIPEDLFTIYSELAEGGTGLIITSFTSVAPVDHFNNGLLRLHDDSLIPEYRKLTDEIHRYGAATMPQLALGIYQRLGKDGHYRHIPVNDMNEADIREVVRKFVSAADRAGEAGFDGVQLHGTHGFVLSNFLNPTENRRQDKYGGSVSARAEILLEIIRGIRETVGDIHISIKVNGGDMPLENLVQTCRLLADGGLDSIEYEGLYSPLVHTLQSVVGLPVILTGGHRKWETVNALLNQYGIDYIGMARPLINDAGLPRRWQSGDVRPSGCRSCGRCMTTYGFRCIFNQKIKQF